MRGGQRGGVGGMQARLGGTGGGRPVVHERFVVSVDGVVAVVDDAGRR